MRILSKNLLTLFALVLALGIYGCSGGKSEKKSSEANPDEVSDIAEDVEGDDESESSALSYNYGGADIGDDATKKAVQDCHENGYVYDRFNGSGGECGKQHLAAVDCTLDALRALLTENQKDQFNANIDGKYDGFDIDQCGDCEADSAVAACDAGDGKEGMIIFFVKESEDEAGDGLSMFMPNRRPYDPLASDSKASVKSGTGGGGTVVVPSGGGGPTLCPDGTYVNGATCNLCGDGSYVGGKCTLCGDGSYVGGQCALCGDGSYAADSCTLCGDGTYAGGGSCRLAPDGKYAK